MAKNAATLLSLGMDEIYMAPGADLGPLDVQITHPDRDEKTVSALDVVGSLEYFSEFAIELTIAGGAAILKYTGLSRSEMLHEMLHFTAEFLQPCVSKIDPSLTREAHSQLKVAERYALKQSQVDAYDRDGYLNAGPVLNEDEIAELSDELDRLIATGPDGFGADEAKPVLFSNISGDADKPVWQVVNVWEASPAFERLVHHPFIVKAISQLTGFNDLQVWHDQMQYKPADHGGCTTWHQDAPLWPIIRPMTPVSAWIPFDDAKEDNGCMWMVAGSHKWSDQMAYLNTQKHLTTLDQFKNPNFTAPAEANGQSMETVCRPVCKGEVHFHHSLTWHGSPTNRSDRPRRALAIHYMTSEAVFVASGEHPMKQFVNLADGASMSEAGAHFPTVMREGEVQGSGVRQ